MSQSRSDPMREMFQKYKVCMARLTVQTADGDLSTGSAFHVGDGFLVTARHVLEGNSLHELVAEHSGQRVKISATYFPRDPRIDLAVLETDFSLAFYMEKSSTISDGAEKIKTDHIEIGGLYDDSLGDELIFSEVLLMGYPRVPFADRAVLVAVRGEINAVIDKYNAPRPHFIVSALPRGGFSGGPVISEYGFLLAVFTESLIENGAPTELGFGSAISAESLLSLLHENQIYPGDNGPLIHCLFDTLPPNP